ncbi:MAG: hypothetical protein MUC63_10810, partial [Planctomycetes bacterium]|nr:hypothetical protein [Planctomycetota bacterium]
GKKGEGGAGSGGANPPADKGGAGGAPEAQKGEWAAGGGEKKEGEEEDAAPTDRSSMTPREREAIQQELDGVKNNLLLGDPSGFEKAFVTWDVLKSVITDLKGKEVWAAMVKAAGGHETQFQKDYKARIRALYEGLRAPGPKCRLDEAQLKSVRNALPAQMVFADTFANPLGRNTVVVLTGFPDGKGIGSLLRFRFLPHHNIRKLYLSGEEAHESAADLAAREPDRIAEALADVARAQEAYRASALADADGDGAGEYGFLEELAGYAPDPAERPKRFESTLPYDLREVAVSGVALRDGLLIRVILPGDGAARFRHRDGRGDAGEGVGRGLYLVGPSGVVLRSKVPSPYRGLEKAPPPACGLKEKGPGADRGDGTPLDGRGTSGTGIEWEPVR